jgi:YD repeat-containing protein
VSYTVDPLVTFEYDALSRLSKATLANGVEETDKYDGRRHWLTQKIYRQSTDTLFTFKNRTYDAMGNLLRADYRYKAESYKWMQYGYNALNRLTSYSDSESGSDSYVYDANGNITSFDGRSFLYESKNNRMTKDGSSSYGFDVIGRVTNAVGSTVTYDHFSNMKTHGTNSYSYDSFGQRIKKTENSVATYSHNEREKMHKF